MLSSEPDTIHCNAETHLAARVSRLQRKYTHWADDFKSSRVFIRLKSRESSYLPTGNREIRKYAVFLILVARVGFQALQSLKDVENFSYLDIRLDVLKH